MRLVETLCTGTPPPDPFTRSTGVWLAADPLDPPVGEALACTASLGSVVVVEEVVVEVAVVTAGVYRAAPPPLEVGAGVKLSTVVGGDWLLASAWAIWLTTLSQFGEVLAMQLVGISVGHSGGVQFDPTQDKLT